MWNVRTLALCVVLTTPAVAPFASWAAETGSFASLNSFGSAAAGARGRGDFNAAHGVATPAMSHGLGIASDAHGISLSGSTAVRGLAGIRGGTINITVGPGRGSASSGYGEAYDCFPSLAVGGSTNPSSANATLRTSGAIFGSSVRASSFRTPSVLLP